MKILGLAFLLACSSAFASTSYDLKMDLSLNGKHVSSPRVIAQEGETATIIQKSDGKETFIDVVTTKADMKNSVMMKFTVGTIGKNGERTILSRPQVIARENETAKISQGETGGQELLSLSVIAKRQIQ
ncbi:MAG: hypothetical protein ACXVLQ_03230 [Bacteriovorax sp.]